MVAQRSPAGVAGGDERRRHAHAIGRPQRHLGDGARAVGRRRRDPAAPGGDRLPRTHRRRVHPRRSRRVGRWRRSARRHRGLARCVWHALRRRDRHHETALERTPRHARARDPRQRQARRARCRPTPLRAGPRGGACEGGRAVGAPPSVARRPGESIRDQAGDRPAANVHRVPGVPEVRHHLPLLRLQAGVVARSRATRGVRCHRRHGRHLVPDLPGAARGRALRAMWTVR